MKIEYIQASELCEAPLIHVDVIGLGSLELPNISGVVSINGQGKADISLIQDTEGFVRVRGQGIDLLASVQGNAMDSPLASLFHLLIGSTFAPGLIGVDWEDVCSLLTAGSNAMLRSVEINQDKDLDPLINDLILLPHEKVRAAICCCCLPKGKYFSNGINLTQDLMGKLEAVTGEFVLGAPIVTADKPILSLLLITG